MIWREKIVIFEDVDLNTMFEVEMNGYRIIRPPPLRAMNRKTLREVHEEIRAFQTEHESGFGIAEFIEKA